MLLGGFRDLGAASERRAHREREHDEEAARRRAAARDAEEEKQAIIVYQQAFGRRPACKACRAALRPCGHVHWDDQKKEWLMFKSKSEY